MPPLLLSVALWLALPAPPHISYVDLDSGPNRGGRDNLGVIVNLYGRGFGDSRGNSTVTIGGGPAGAYLAWSDRNIAIQTGPAAKSGAIVAHTAGGDSNGAPFQVRSGGIYFVSPAGNDAANGSWANPWKSLIKARDASRAGDTIYAMNGVSQLADDGYGWDAALTLHAETSGTASAPRALIAYPGAKVTIGSVTGPRFGIRTTGPPSHWTIAGLILRGSMTGAHVDGPAANWRFVQNDLSCPNNHTGSCFSTSKTNYVQFYGNHVHDVGAIDASAMNHGVYFTTDSNHLDVGWNVIENVRGCRGLQVHSTAIEQGTGHDQFDILIHDNIIHDTQCDGIVLATVDPSKGRVEVWNNVIYNAGKGPNNPERTGHWSCILVAGTTNGGQPGRGVVEIYNNTLVNCGTFTNPPYSNARAAITNSGKNPNLRIRIRNNILVQQQAAAPYLTVWQGEKLCLRRDCTGIFGSHNLFYGNGDAPANGDLGTAWSLDPQFVDPARHKYQLSQSSPARGVGLDVHAGSTEREEDARLQKKRGYDLGACPVPEP